MERLLAWFSGRTRPLPSTTTPYPVNDHIYKLYKPPEDIEPSIDILFFHGLQFGQSTDAYRSTWTCGSGDAPEQVWPSTWLVEEFPNAQIFSMSYDSCIRKTKGQGRFDLHNVAENMIQSIVWAGIGQERPVVLVGHCFGGLVMKALCVKAHHTYSLGLPGNQEIEQFLHNVRGLFFYRTPHHGSPAFDKASSLFSGLLLDYVKVLSEKPARLHADFTAVCKIYNIQYIASVGESHPTSWKNLYCEVVVPEASARYGNFITVATDHIKICKPASKTSNSFVYLITFLKLLDVQRKVASRLQNRQFTTNPLFGLDRAVHEFEGLLRLNEKVGIVGIGGIGKTTLAKAAFNKLGPTFDYSYFIGTVKKIEGSVKDVEKEIWNRLQLHGKEGLSYDTGRWSMLRTKRLLLVLDDISSERDLEVLSNIANALEAGESRFIVTSRDGVLLNNMDFLYRIPFLDYVSAKQLFTNHAFPKQSVPPSALQSSVEDIVEKCGGLPLTLELMGKYFHNKNNVQVWKETLRDLDKANVFSSQDQKLWEQLRSCYNGLGEKEQQVFLDATTFFVDTTWTLHEAITTWGSLYDSPHRLWHTLLDMSFVYDVGEDEPIKVHEQLQSLGKKIASESTKCRIWEYREALKLLQSTDESDGQQIHSLRLESFESQRGSTHVDILRSGYACGRDETEGLKVDVSRSGFRRLYTVQYLDLQVDVPSRDLQKAQYRYFDEKIPVSIQFEGAQDKQVFPTNQLVLLRCNDEQFDGLPFSPSLFTRLVVLELSCSTCVIEHLPRFIGQFSTLKIFKISSQSLESLPDEIGSLLTLEHLTLKCSKLEKLPKSFGDLSNLKHLELRCGILTTLPESFGQLKELKHLVFDDLAGSRRSENLYLPESFGDLHALEHIKFKISNLGSLPESFGHLPTLKHLEFHYSRKLHSLPESFGRLSTLEHLEFGHCEHLASLPESFGHLSALKHLEFHYCHKLESLPESFGRLSTLEHLGFSLCWNFSSLPESFGHLPALRHLTVNACKLDSLPESFGHLPALRLLTITDPKLDSLPESFGHLPTLEHLEFCDCQYLASLPESFGHLLGLKHLEFRHCHKLDSLPESFGRLSTLEHLKIYRCSDLASLPMSFGQLAKLQDLVINDCPSMHRLPNSLAELKDLRRLVIKYIPITSIPDSIKALPSLETLELGDLPCVEEFPPWLGEIAPVDFTPVSIKESTSVKEILNKRIFHVRYGCFALAEEKTVAENHRDWNDKLMLWLEKKATGKLKSSDYGGALVALDRYCEFESAFYRCNPGVSRWERAAVWVKRGILNRLCGDFQGALEDLNSAMNLLREFRKGSGPEFLRYSTRRERGYVRYILLGDEEGAREDGEKAFKFQCRITDLHVFEYGANVNQRFIKKTLPDEYDVDINKFVLDRPVLSYLNFEFWGGLEYVENVNHLHSLHSQAMEKVRRSDFAGALADFDAVHAINVRLTGFRAQAYMLQERGILKRFMGDLDGALNDLSSALKLFANHKFKGGLYSFASGYESWKHRGYVKFLQKDVDGAQEDAATAQKLKKDQRKKENIYRKMGDEHTPRVVETCEFEDDVEDDWESEDESEDDDKFEACKSEDASEDDDEESEACESEDEIEDNNEEFEAWKSEDASVDDDWGFEALGFESCESEDESEDDNEEIEACESEDKSEDDNEEFEACESEDESEDDNEEIEACESEVESEVFRHIRLGSESLEYLGFNLV